MRPQIFGTSYHSVASCGRMPIFRPMTAPAETIAGTATNSGGTCIRSATSAIQGAKGAGSIPRSKGMTGVSPVGSGDGSGQMSGTWV